MVKKYCTAAWRPGRPPSGPADRYLAFGALVLATIVLEGALSFLAAFALGPIAEALRDSGVGCEPATGVCTFGPWTAG